MAIYRVVEPNASCKCCHASADLYGVCDFSKSCEDRRAPQLPLSGIPVYYHRCPRCGFIFTGQFDDFSKADFQRLIYNEQYLQVDPDYRRSRPTRNSAFVARVCGELRTQLRILDFGSGNGELADHLSRMGFSDVLNYDPFHPPHDRCPEGKFHLILAFEVLEHVIDPRRVFAEWSGRLDESQGLILFSTLLQPPDIDQRGVSWWYIAPRNGHISILSRESLRHLAAQNGLQLLSVNADLHLAFVRFPEFARDALLETATPSSSPAARVPSDSSQRIDGDSMRLDPIHN